MFSLRFTIVLLAILLIPCLIRVKYGHELFPSMMMPSGARKVQVGSEKFEVSYTTPFAMKKDGSWDRVDIKRFLDPIPPHFQKYILDREFGLKENQPPPAFGSLTPILVKLNIVKSRDANEHDRKEVKIWLKRKLQEQGFFEDKFKIVRIDEVISIPDGNKLSEENTDEKIIYLD
ncbi:hypothetical protein ACMA1I_22225 [Pontibacter sp. 13R65]|uniref:hypothetical protein n=1 Tax=Pontibacter sp. 13R65 TaxID=3127458 RepID=UPI00301D186E